MKNDSTENYSKISRRRALRGVGGLTALGVTSIVSSNTAAAADPGTQLWSFETEGSIESSPTIVDGTVFVGCNGSAYHSESSFKSGSFYAVNAETGQEEWSFEAGQGFDSSATVADGRVFFGSFDDNLYALDTETGRKEWVFDAHGIGSSPTVFEGTVFIGSYNNLYAVDAETGDQEWVFETDIASSPTVSSGTVFVGSGDNNLYAVDAETGDQQWVFETGDSVYSSPTVANGTVFVGSRDNNLYAVDTETGQEEWAFETGGVVDCSPTVSDNVVFFGSGDERFYALDAETGQEEWVSYVPYPVRSSPTVADGTLFIAADNEPNSLTLAETSDDGIIGALDLETGEPKWSLNIGIDFSSPTVANGTLFIGSSNDTDGNIEGGKLVAVDTDVTGSSDGSRAKLGTLGHHGDRKNAGQATTTLENLGLPESLSLSGVPTPAVIAAGGGTIGVGIYAYRRWRRSDDTESNDTEEN
ncbi:hypothetical protein DM826_05300 [Halonotius aquaticus]|uniref:Pyrrolo-quinoline quinone repeat domain-containing protein n=1 Tax=Halonotius aquaticus TaxID=2216978 RepID=A0A3A6PVL2_9EURY|nr:PQQ-binding-like beta-propeller repeat protein [Halonotius aquaticus]RJX43669.1 hypothetical protein DM826_05300 [Halonotius aquaticus]